jgi:Phosphatidylethanolamine-binding protein
VAETSPPPNWSDYPAATRIFMLLCDDPDAQRVLGHHWTAHDIPVECMGSRKVRLCTSAGRILVGLNDFRRPGLGVSATKSRKTRSRLRDEVYEKFIADHECGDAHAQSTHAAPKRALRFECRMMMKDGRLPKLGQNVSNNSVRIAAWNIASNRNHAAITSRIAELNLDICAMQEVWLDCAADLPAILGSASADPDGYCWYFAPALSPHQIDSRKSEYFWACHPVDDCIPAHRLISTGTQSRRPRYECRDRAPHHAGMCAPIRASLEFACV